MKKYILSLAAFLLIGTATISAQRVAVVDINLVLEGLAEYQGAQKELDKLAAEWRQEIASEYDAIKSMYNKYQAEQVLLSDEVRRQREEAIVNREKAVRERQKQRFGPEGALFKRRQQMVQPIQDKVYTALEDFASAQDFDIILDKGGSAGILFANPRFDKTEELIKKLR